MVMKGKGKQSNSDDESNDLDATCNAVADGNVDTPDAGSSVTHGEEPNTALRRKVEQLDKVMRIVHKMKKSRDWKCDSTKPAREIKPRCSCNFKTIKCVVFNDEDGVQIFNKFWRMDWAKRKEFVESSIIQKTTARPRGKSNMSRRSFSFEYYLPKDDDELRVCKNMFISTLAGAHLNFNKNSNDPSCNSSCNIPDTSSFVSDDRPSRRKRQSVHELWDVNKMKKAREHGLEYIGKRKINGKWKFDPKPPREMKPRCSCSSLKKTVKCADFDEEDRIGIFNRFWSMNWGEKKVFVDLLMVQKRTAKPRERDESNVSRRSYSFEYYLPKGDEHLRVCKTMFINTLAAGSWMAGNWKKKLSSASNDTSSDQEGQFDCSMDDMDNHRTEVQLLECKEFFNTLEKVDSHYCRDGTIKLYLEPKWKSKESLYESYRDDWCLLKDADPASSSIFENVFEDENLSLFQVNTDECDICEGLEEDEMRREKENDVLMNVECICILEE